MLLKSSKEDTNKINILNKLCVELEKDRYFDSALTCAKGARKKAIEIGFEKGVANSFFNSASVESNQHHYPIAMKQCAIALKIFLKINDEKGVADCLYNLGNIYHFNRFNNSKAFTCWSLAQKRYEALNDKKNIANCYNAISNGYSAQINYEERGEYLFKALKIFELIGDKEAIGMVYNNISIMYSEQGKNIKALQYLQAAQNIFIEINDLERTAGIYDHIGLIKQSELKYKEALEYFNKGLTLKNKLGDSLRIAESFDRIGSVYFDLYQHDKAMKFFLDTKRIYEKLGSREDIVLVTSQLGAIYAFSNNTKEARKCFEISCAFHKEIDNKEGIRDCYRSFSMLNEIENNYKDAFVNYKLYISCRDSIYNKENTEKIIHSEIQYEFDKKEALLKAEQEKQKALQNEKLQTMRVTYISVSVILILIFCGLFFYQKNKVKKQQLAQIITTQESERKRIATDLHDGLGQLLLGAKMQLDLLKDDVNSDIKKELDKSIHILKEAAEETNHIAHNLMPVVLSKLGLKRALQELVQSIKDANPTIHLNYNEEDFIEDVKNENVQLNIYRVVQEILNNISKHANATEISFNIKSIHQKIIIDISDNGNGFEQLHEKVNKRISLGLENIKARMGFIGGVLKITSAIGKGSKFVIHIDNR